MDSRNIDKNDELPVADTPEDVAVLYSWANLHGAKYRDFSASRREYRAQLRHRAAEQMREQELKAQAEAESAAIAAEAMARQAQVAAMASNGGQADSSRQQALREAGQAARIASAERVEAARRAEAAAIAEAEARRAEREIAEATESARQQASRYTDSEIRRRASGINAAAVPGEISDPYVPHAHLQSPALPAERIYERPATQRNSMRQSNPVAPAVTPEISYEAPQAAPQQVFASTERPASGVSISSSQRRRGYTPDDASGVRQIYRGPEFEESKGVEPIPYASPAEPNRVNIQAVAAPIQVPEVEIPVQAPEAQASWANAPTERRETENDRGAQRPATPNVAPPMFSGQPFMAQRTGDASRGTAIPSPRMATQYPQAGPSDSSRGRRSQDDLGYKPGPSYPEVNRKPNPQQSRTSSGAQRMSYAPDSAAPAWLYAPQVAAPQPPAPQVIQVRQGFTGLTSGVSGVQSSVADTLQHSRERVAARWFALKGVFEQPGQEPQQEQPVRQKEIRTPVLAVFSLAGGVGKTSLVATLGRALSALGEKVLLTDTTSHGLLPFYFGASELRQGVVRTFSPPSGSTDAPIYLLSYDVAERGGDEDAQEKLIEDIKGNSKGTHRILLDLTPGSGWVARKMSRMNPTILVPVAPDMNSVISLQAVEKYFHGTVDADGRPLQPYYVINQFDASLPLHLDVREVLRRQLGERLLPFVIRRTPTVSEALAEGMTIIDYAPETPIAEDYQNVAAWLRTISAPATAGFRNVRWSER
jgi:cellulose synthase operon protein YhjQ